MYIYTYIYIYVYKVMAVYRLQILLNAEVLASLLFLFKTAWHTVAKWVLAKVLASGFPQWHTEIARSKIS